MEDCSQLQADLNSIVGWCNVNGLTPNNTKTYVMTYSRKKKALQYNYGMGGVTVSRKWSVKDLGITFDVQLTFVDHINNIVNSANKMLGFVIRNTKSFTNTAALKSIYFAMVRSKLEYCSIIWAPFYACHTINIERVHRKFLKFLYFRTHRVFPVQGYDQNLLLTEFNMESLKKRRFLSSIRFLHGLLHGVIDSIELVSLIQFHVKRNNARFAIDFAMDRCRTNIGMNAPMHVMCANGNLLSNICDIYNDSLGTILNVASEEYLRRFQLC